MKKRIAFICLFIISVNMFFTTSLFSQRARNFDLVKIRTGLGIDTDGYIGLSSSTVRFVFTDAATDYVTLTSGDFRLLGNLNVDDGLIYNASTGVVSFKNYSFPLSDGLSGYVLAANGTGGVEWAPVNQPVGSGSDWADSVRTTFGTKDFDEIFNSSFEVSDFVDGSIAGSDINATFDLDGKEVQGFDYSEKRNLHYILDNNGEMYYSPKNFTVGWSDYLFCINGQGGFIRVNPDTVILNSNHQVAYIIFNEDASNNIGYTNVITTSNWVNNDSLSKHDVHLIASLSYSNGSEASFYTPLVQLWLNQKIEYNKLIADSSRAVPATSGQIDSSNIIRKSISPDELDNKYIFTFNNISKNISKITPFLTKYLKEDTGADSLLTVVITGSSIFGANSGSLGYSDTTCNPTGCWTKLQGYFLQDSLNYSDSDLEFFTRSHSDITWNGTWGYTYGQWGSETHVGKCYKESGSASAYVEIEVDSCEHFAIIYEAYEHGDTLRCTIDGGLPSAHGDGITGSDSVFTYYDDGSSDNYIPLKHSFYHGFDYNSTYTIRFMKSTLTSDSVKVWGFMKWTYHSIEVITSARSGQSAGVAANNFYENVTAYSPDVVINQLHDVNESGLALTNYYNDTSTVLDSLDHYSYPFISIISNKKWAEGNIHKQSVQMSRILLAEEDRACIDMYALTKENRFPNGYFNRDGVHPNLVGIIYYVDEILKILKIKCFAGY